MASPPNAPSPAAPTEIRRVSWRLDVSDAVDLPGRFEIATDVIAPAEHDPKTAPPVLCCLPGGFLSRKYFDMELDGDRRFSFAEHMARQGFSVLAFDHIGVGESTKPDPIEAGYRLGPEAIARANQAALEAALARLAEEDAAKGIRALATKRTIGVGHSMGSALTVEQQALSRPHEALVLFSFSTAGLVAFLEEDQRPYANDPVRSRADIGELVRRSMGSPYPVRPAGRDQDQSAAFGVGSAPPEAARALRKASTNLLALAGLLTMIPDGYGPPAQEIDVPAFVAVGDHDLHPTKIVPPMLPRAPEITLYTLEDCWHCHFLANTREKLWDRTARWIREIAT